MNERRQTFGWLLGVVLIALAGTAAYFYFPFGPKVVTGSKDNARVTYREPKGVKFKRPEDAALYGIDSAGVKAVSWRPRIFVDGRVVPNPHATVDVRAPCAGIFRVDGSTAALRLGGTVATGEILALFEARLTPAEKLDIKVKVVDAEARYKSADDVLKIRQDRLARLEKLSAGILPQDDLDGALVQLAEARTQKNIVAAQWSIWKRALESAGDQKIIETLSSPIAGVIVEVGAQPGAHVEPGQLLVRIVDLGRVLVRLDFPLSGSTTKIPASVEVESLDGPGRWRASSRGPAPNLEIGLQRASRLFEIVPTGQAGPPHWQPGLFVRAVLDDPHATAKAAIALPATALLVHQGRTLVYIEKRPGRYERREVEVFGRDGDVLYVAPDGWLAREDRVVVKGAQVLLSEEFRSDVDDD